MIEGGAVQELLEGADLFGIKDVVTNQSFIVKANHLVFDDSLDAGVIKLNRRQRILLGERLPCRLEDELRQQVVAYIKAEEQVAGTSEEQPACENTMQAADQEKPRSLDGLAILEKTYPAHEPIRKRASHILKRRTYAKFSSAASRPVLSSSRLCSGRRDAISSSVLADGSRICMWARARSRLCVGALMPMMRMIVRFA